MGADYYYMSEIEGQLEGSDFGEGDGTKHDIDLLEGNGKMILRVKLEGHEDPTDLIFTPLQAQQFAGACQGVLRRLGLDG